MSEDDPTCRKGHPKTVDNWSAKGYCRECKRVTDAARRGTELHERRVYDPDQFPCGHPRVEDNLTKRGQCRECARLNAARTAQRKREERIAEHGPERRKPASYDPARYPCGHPRTSENTAKTSWNGACRTCKNAKKMARYYAHQEAAGKARRIVDPNRFPCGHPRNPENTRQASNTCKECNRIKQSARYRAQVAAEGRELWVPDPDWFPCGHPRVAANFRGPWNACRACSQERATERYRQGKMPTAGDPELIRRRNQMYVQCRRDERADPDTWAYLDIIRRDPCSYCGGQGGTRDHVIPMSTGGPNHWTNYTGACQSCNLSKSDKSLLTFLLDRTEMERVRRERRGA